jgi:hypothetical protein
MDKLPDNVIKITTLTINRNKRKNCDCYDSYPRQVPQYEIDTTNREVICKHCGVIVDPFDALLIISKRWERVSEEINSLFAQARELREYKPWLLTIRKLEQQCRSGTMVLSCPHCHEGILFEEMTAWTNKEIELDRRKK